MRQRHNLWARLAIATLSLLGAGCAHRSSAPVTSQDAAPPAGDPPFVPLPTAQLPVVEHDHRIVAVGRYPLPLPIVLPATLSPLPTATALFSNTKPDHSLLSVDLSFPDKDSKTFLAWAQTFPVCVLHPGVAVWHSKHCMYLERSPAPMTGYAYVPRPLSQVPIAWTINGFFHTKDWLCTVYWKRGDVFIRRSVYPVPTKKNDLSLSLGFMRLPMYVWLPLHEKDRRIVSVGRYHLPDPIPLPPGIVPVPSALATFRRQPSLRLVGFRIFFPPKAEAAVFRWAQSRPTLLPGAVGSWQPTGYFFWAKSKGGTGGVGFSEKLPPAVPTAWLLSGTMQTRSDRIYSALSGKSVVSAADLKSNPAARYLLSVSAADYVGGSDDYGSNSPLRGEQRHVSLSVSFNNIQVE